MSIPHTTTTALCSISSFARVGKQPSMRLPTKQPQGQHLQKIGDVCPEKMISPPAKSGPAAAVRGGVQAQPRRPFAVHAGPAETHHALTREAIWTGFLFLPYQQTWHLFRLAGKNHSETSVQPSDAFVPRCIVWPCAPLLVTFIIYPHTSN